MLLAAKCPNCRKEVKVPRSASLATCPNCFTTFRADETPDEEEAVGTAATSAGAAAAATPTIHVATVPAQDDAEASWISPWFAGAFCLTTLGALQASPYLGGIWWLTVAFGFVSVLMIVQGLRATHGKRRGADIAWFSISSVASVTLLVIALGFPGLLNNWWAIDRRVATVDPNIMVQINRDVPLEQGKPMAATDWADAVTDAIRQEDMFVRVESVKMGSVPGKDGQFLLVHLRLANCKHENSIAIEGFAGETQPVLTDESGRNYSFIEQRPRKPAKGPPVFDPKGPRSKELAPMERQDYQLVFAAPQRFEPLRLEVPAGAWGRKGTCKLRITRLFDAPIRPTK